MHPAKNQVLHVDLQRVLADQPIRIHLPIHFLNEATCPGVKVQGGLVSHLRTDVEITCLPKDLPEALEVDMARHEPERHDVPEGHQAAARRDDSGAVDQVATFRWCRSTHRVRTSRRAGCRRSRCCGCRADCGDAEALPMRRRTTPRQATPRRGEGRRQEVSAPARLSDLASRLTEMPGTRDQAHRGPGQSRTRVRNHPAQRRVLARGRAGAAPWRQLPPGAALPVRSWRACRSRAQECWLVKPQDFMNNSGRVTAAVASFYKVECRGAAGCAR